MSELLTLRLSLIPPHCQVYAGDELLPGIHDITIIQNDDSVPKAFLSVSLSGVTADIYADQCRGALDPDTEKVLERLPAKVLRDLAESILRIADDIETTSSDTSTVRSL